MGVALTAELEEVVEQGRAAWPRLALSREGFAAFVSDRSDTPEELERLRPADLYLVYGCTCGDRVAYEELETHYLSQVPRMLTRLKLSAEEADEVRQQLRQRLLVGTAQGPARLSAYAGRGDLRNWIRTAAIRLGQNYIAADARAAAVVDDGLSRAVEHRDLQLDYLRREYGREFKAAFEGAVTRLTTRDRNVLRLHYIDGVTSDGLSAMYGVHRATAARWVAHARRKLATETRRALMAKLGVGKADLQSIIRLIHSQLDASVRRVLK